MADTTILALLGVVISVFSLGVSATTMYFTWLRRGQLAMTKPTLVFFGYDAVPKIIPKVFLRTLLYSTSPQGKMIEHMYAKLIRDGTEKVFGFWGYGPDKQLTAGGSLFVGQTGVSAYHHFVLSVHDSGYEFGAGEYTIQVFVRQAGRAEAMLLSEIKLTLDREQAEALAKRIGIIFELEPATQTYLGHARKRPLAEEDQDSDA